MADWVTALIGVVVVLVSAVASYLAGRARARRPHDTQGRPEEGPAVGDYERPEIEDTNEGPVPSAGDEVDVDYWESLEEE